MKTIGIELTKRIQDKAPSMHIRVRNHQMFLLRDQVIVKEQIQIQGSGSPVSLSFSPGFLLNFHQFGKHFVRSQQGIKSEDSIEKIPLILITVGSSFNQNHYSVYTDFVRILSCIYALLTTTIYAVLQPFDSRYMEFVKALHARRAIQ